MLHRWLIQAQGPDRVIINRFTYCKGWLVDRIINYCMSIVKVQYRMKGGLQPCEQGFKKEKGYFLQIINTASSPGQHWLLLEGFLEESPPRFRIFDSGFSLPRGLSDSEIRMKLVECVTEYILSSIQELVDSKQYNIEIMKCPKQKTEYDCGVVAIANLVSRANYIDLHNIDYLNSVKIRTHLENCVSLREMSMFPHVSIPNDSNTVLGTIEIKMK